jgi:hypothetical protein
VGADLISWGPICVVCRFPVALFQVGGGDRAEPEEPLPHEHDRGAAPARSEPHGGGQHPFAVDKAVRRFSVFHQWYTLTAYFLNRLNC